MSKHAESPVSPSAAGLLMGFTRKVLGWSESATPTRSNHGRSPSNSSWQSTHAVTADLLNELQQQQPLGSAAVVGSLEASVEFKDDWESKEGQDCKESTESKQSSQSNEVESKRDSPSKESVESKQEFPSKHESVQETVYCFDDGEVEIRMAPPSSIDPHSSDPDDLDVSQLASHALDPVDSDGDSMLCHAVPVIVQPSSFSSTADPDSTLRNWNSINSGGDGATAVDVLQQFDPLAIPRDWMATPRTDSAPTMPSAWLSLPSAHSVQSGLLHAATSAADDDMGPISTPSVLKIRSLIDYGSPSSVVRYTEQDLQSAMAEVQSRLQTQMEAQAVEMSSRVELAEQARQQMKSIVDEYEATMTRMIGKSVEDGRLERERNQLLLTKATEEKGRLVTELTTLETSFKDLRLRYEELKGVVDQGRKNEAGLRSTIDQLQRDIQASEQRVETIKQHAEKKLTEANEEVDRLRHAQEKDMALLRAKLQKAELKIKGLERTIEQKQAENAELVAICDDLIHKMESSPAGPTARPQ